MWIHEYHVSNFFKGNFLVWENSNNFPLNLDLTLGVFGFNF